MEEATWLSPIVVVSKKNKQFQICMDFQKLNATTKNDPYPLPFMEEVLDMVAGHEVYLFFDGFLGYHQIIITLEDKCKNIFITDHGTLVWIVLPFGLKNAPPTY
jgi:hypothetical protein